MQKLILLSTIFSFLCGTITQLNGMDCCLRLLCCLGKKQPIAEPVNNIHRIEAIRNALRDAQQTQPSALRALYLKCQLPNYVFAQDDQEYLEIHTFIDTEGTINPQDCNIILSLLLPSESCLDSSDWDYYQRVVDFAHRHPAQAAQFSASCSAPAGTAKSVMPANVLTILHGTYELITNAESISLLERRLINAMIPSTETKLEQFIITQPHLSTRPAIRSSAPYGTE